MYQLLNALTGEKINVDKPRYVKQNARGTWVKCTPAEAQCISVEGVRYSIYNRPQVEDAPEFLIVKEVDIGGEMQELLREKINQASTIEEIKTAIIDCYDCIWDIYENRYNQ